MFSWQLFRITGADVNVVISKISSSNRGTTCHVESTCGLCEKPFL